MYRKVIVFLLTILVVIIIAGCLKPSHQKNVKAIVSQTPAETEHIPDAPSPRQSCQRRRTVCDFQAERNRFCIYRGRLHRSPDP